MHMNKKYANCVLQLQSVKFSPPFPGVSLVRNFGSGVNNWTYTCERGTTA